MPVTPLHYGAAYVISKLKIGLVLPALVVGSMIPDIEVFAAVVTVGSVPSRGLMHSLVGAVTVDAFLAILVTVFLYPSLVSWIFRLEKKDAAEKCCLSGKLMLSALIGTLSHVMIDAIHHEYNPLLYPFNSESYDAFIFLNDWRLASMIVHTVVLGLLLIILIYEIREGTQGFWKRLLIG